MKNKMEIYFLFFWGWGGVFFSFSFLGCISFSSWSNRILLEDGHYNDNLWEIFRLIYLVMGYIVYKPVSHIVYLYFYENLTKEVLSGSISCLTG